jgi:hypothetical protein
LGNNQGGDRNMKIIAVDNFDRETSDDRLICENVDIYYANLIVRLLNDSYGDNSDTFFKAVENEYKLYKYEY